LSGSILFLAILSPRQSCSSLVGFVRLVPGFVEGHKLLQRVNGVGVLGTELGFAALNGVSNSADGALLCSLQTTGRTRSDHPLVRRGFLQRGWLREGSQAGSDRSNENEIHNVLGAARPTSRLSHLLSVFPWRDKTL
jgi:hypothetical protein